MNWIPVGERKPTHIYSVLLWVIGGPLHFDEDYCDVGIYRPEHGDWRTNGGDAGDVTVEVSHWCEIDAPQVETARRAA